MSYANFGFYLPTKVASIPRSRKDVVVHLRSQKASIARLSQPKQPSNDSESTLNSGDRRRALRSAGNRPTTESIFDGTTREISKFFTARRLDRQKRLATIGGLKHRPDSASVHRRVKKNMISKSFSQGPRVSRKGIGDPDSPTKKCWRKRNVSPIQMDAVGDNAKGTNADANARFVEGDNTAGKRDAFGRPDGVSDMPGPPQRRASMKAANKQKHVAKAMTPRKRLMTTELRHHRAKQNRESVVNMDHNKRILRLIGRQDKLEALHKKRILSTEKAKLERKEQRRLKWIQDNKRNAYLWEMNNYMSRGRSKPKSKHRPFLKDVEKEEEALRESLQKSYADLFIDEPAVYDT